MGNAAGRPRPSLAELAYDALFEAIWDRRVGPGTRLKIDELSRSLQMSTTPVREALSRALALGIVELGQGRTYTVTATLTEAEVRMLFTVRLALETTALAEATPSQEEVAALQTSVERMRSVPPGPSFSEFRESIHADQLFHEAIVSMPHNPYLLRAWQTLNSHLQLSRLYAESGVVEWAQHGVAEHVAIVEAIVAGKQKAAVDALVAHLNAAEERLASLARALDDETA